MGCLYDAVGQRLFLVGGTFDGNVEILLVNATGVSHVASLHGGHTAVVRGIAWDMASNQLLSSGEDTVLCLWGSTPPMASPSSNSLVERHARSREHSSKARKAAAPY